MNTPVFSGSLVRLSAEDPKTYAEHFSRWWQDSEYSRLLDMDPARLFSPKRSQEWLEKELGKESPEIWMFGIRTLADDRLIGFLDLDASMPHSDSFIGIGLGEREYWGKGYGGEAMRLALGFGFRVLGLRRVSLCVFDYNPRAMRSYRKAGFRLEGTERQVIQRDGQRFDLHFMGVLRQEWEALQQPEKP